MARTNRIVNQGMVKEKEGRLGEEGLRLGKERGDLAGGGPFEIEKFCYLGTEFFICKMDDISYV